MAKIIVTCTVGIGPNILIAKLASDLAKPDGLRWIDEDSVPSVLDALPVKKLWGIGSHTEEKLRAMGITTCGELGRAPLSLLTKKFSALSELLPRLTGNRFRGGEKGSCRTPLYVGTAHCITREASNRRRALVTNCRISDKGGFLR